jgi:hypothetical protein
MTDEVPESPDSFNIPNFGKKRMFRRFVNSFEMQPFPWLV